jgi:hypothetical protein
MSIQDPAPATLSSPVTPDIDTAEQAYAVVFLQDLATNKRMAAGWAPLLKALAADTTMSATDKEQAVENFVAGTWGYQTTGADVLNIVKADWWTFYQAQNQPNVASDRFVQSVLQDTTLYKGFAQQLSAAQQAGKLDDFDTWLRSDLAPVPYPESDIPRPLLRSRTRGFGVLLSKPRRGIP